MLLSNKYCIILLKVHEKKDIYRYRYRYRYKSRRYVFILPISELIIKMI